MADTFDGRPTDKPLIGGNNELADKVRAAYPGKYDDLDDETLTQAVIQKFPQYRDLALPYDAIYQGKPVRRSTLTGDQRLQTYDYRPPQTPQEYKSDTLTGLEAGSLATLPLSIGATLPQLIGGGLGGTVAGIGGQQIAKKLGAGELTQRIVGDISGVAGGVAGGLAGGRLANYLSGSGVQAELQQGIRARLAAVAKENGVEESKAASIRDVAQETGDAILAKSKATYQQIDQATGGRFQRFSDALKRIDRQIAEVADIDPEKEAALTQRRSEIQQATDQVFEEAKGKGVDADTIESAKANYKKAQALYDLDKQINMSTSGFRKGIESGGNHTPEVVDANKLSSRMEKLYKTGRLQEAVGEDHATELMKQADASLMRAQKVQAVAKTAKKAGTAAVAGAAAAAGAAGVYEAVK